MQAKGAFEKMAERVIGIDVERLLQGGFGVLDLFKVVEQFRPATPDLGIVGMFRRKFFQGAQSGLMLAFGVLTKCFVDFDVNWLAAPLELLAAAARTRRVKIEHAMFLPEWRRGVLPLRIADAWALGQWPACS